MPRLRHARPADRPRGERGELLSPLPDGRADPVRPLARPLAEGGLAAHDRGARAEPGSRLGPRPADRAAAERRLAPLDRARARVTLVPTRNRGSRTESVTSCACCDALAVAQK